MKKLSGHNPFHGDTRINIRSPDVDGSQHWNDCRGKWTEFRNSKCLSPVMAELSN